MTLVWQIVLVWMDVCLVGGLGYLLRALYKDWPAQFPYIVFGLFTTLCFIAKSSFYDAHTYATQSVFGRGKKNDDVAGFVVSLMNPAASVSALLVYLIQFTFRMGTQCFDWIYEIHIWLDHILAEWFDYFSQYLLQFLRIPFNLVMNLILAITSRLNEQLWNFVQLFQDAGNLIIQTLISNREKVIREWFGTGVANERTYNQAFALVLAYNILVVGVMGLFCCAVYMYAIPRIPKEWIPEFLTPHIEIGPKSKTK